MLVLVRLEKLISTGKSVPFFPKVVLPVMAWMRPKAITIDFAEFAYKGGKSAGRQLEIPVRASLCFGSLLMEKIDARGDALSDDQISLLRQWIK